MNSSDASSYCMRTNRYSPVDLHNLEPNERNEYLGGKLSHYLLRRHRRRQQRDLRIHTAVDKLL